MVRVNPFEAVRPVADAVERVACPPYDVVSTAEARAIAAGNGDCFMRVIRPEVDLPDGTDPYADAVYAGAARALADLMERGVLVRDDAPGLYLYAQEAELMGRLRRQVGVVGCCHVEDYLRDAIKKHERTRQAKEDDRTRHVLETNANTGPVFLLHRDDEAIAELVERDTQVPPIYDFVAPDGVRHTLWRAADPTDYAEAFAKHAAVYVADGHHRSASAARAGAERRAANPDHTGEEEYNWFLAVLFPAGALTILPYNRVVHDLNGKTPEEVIDALRALGAVEQPRLHRDAPRPIAPGSLRRPTSAAPVVAPRPSTRPDHRHQADPMATRSTSPAPLRSASSGPMLPASTDHPHRSSASTSSAASAAPKELEKRTRLDGD
jgi:uncharacterized protein (DUF1015 family)